jgi:hypothetical protein
MDGYEELYLHFKKKHLDLQRRVNQPETGPEQTNDIVIEQWHFLITPSGINKDSVKYLRVVKRNEKL